MLPATPMTSSTALNEIQNRMRRLACPETARILRGFFKTGPGQYGEGDVFLGIRVPTIRSVAKEFPDAGLNPAVELLHSPFHEERLLALLLLMRYFAAGDDHVRQSAYQAYLDNTQWINNWDLVDISAPPGMVLQLPGRGGAAVSTGLLSRVVGATHRNDRDLAIHPPQRFQHSLQLAEKLLDDRKT